MTREQWGLLVRVVNVRGESHQIFIGDMPAGPLLAYPRAVRLRAWIAAYAADIETFIGLERNKAERTTRAASLPPLPDPDTPIQRDVATYEPRPDPAGAAAALAIIERLQSGGRW